VVIEDMKNEQENPNYHVGELFNGKLLLNVQEVAQALNCSPRTVYNQVSAKTFPIRVKRRGKLVRFDVRDLIAYVNSL
jgi:excisionase family DNA binding protein